MRRRPLIVVAAVTAVASGAGWWLSAGLSAEEERLVGMWMPRTPAVDNDDGMRLDRDRTCEFVYADGSICTYGAGDGSRHRSYPPARWHVRGGHLVIDFELNGVRRALRPVAGRVGLAVGDVARDRLEWVSADGIVLTSENGRRVPFARATPKPPKRKPPPTASAALIDQPREGL